MNDAGAIGTALQNDGILTVRRVYENVSGEVESFYRAEMSDEDGAVTCGEGVSPIKAIGQLAKKLGDAG